MKKLEYKPCRKCVNKPGPQKGFYYDKSASGKTIIVECQCHVKYMKELAFRRALVKSNLPQEEYRFSDYVGPSKQNAQYLENIADNFPSYADKMIYIYGLNGTQKTAMSTALGWALLRKGYKVQYALMDTLIKDIQPDFSSDVNKDELIQKYYDCDLLILDESFDKSKVSLYKSGYQLPYLDSFIRTRFDIQRKAILFISNVAPQKIKDQEFGISLQNFIERNCQDSTVHFEDSYTTCKNEEALMAAIKERA